MQSERKNFPTQWNGSAAAATALDVEAFIHALDEASRLHRRCERSRIEVDKHLAEHGR
jgi:hypothetical protein